MLSVTHDIHPGGVAPSLGVFLRPLGISRLLATGGCSCCLLLLLTRLELLSRTLARELWPLEVFFGSKVDFATSLLSFTFGLLTMLDVLSVGDFELPIMLETYTACDPVGMRLRWSPLPRRRRSRRQGRHRFMDRQEVVIAFTGARRPRGSRHHPDQSSSGLRRFPVNLGVADTTWPSCSGACTVLRAW